MKNELWSLFAVELVESMRHHRLVWDVRRGYCDHCGAQHATTALIATGWWCAACLAAEALVIGDDMAVVTGDTRRAAFATQLVDELNKYQMIIRITETGCCDGCGREGVPIADTPDSAGWLCAACLAARLTDEEVTT